MPKDIIINKDKLELYSKELRDFIKEILKNIKVFAYLYYNKYNSYINLNEFINIKHFLYSLDKSLIYVYDIKYNPIGLINYANYAFIWLPDIFTTNDNDNKKIVYRMLKIFNALDKENPKGWVIDLRGNTGGYIEHYVAAISPLLSKFIISGINKKTDQTLTIESDGNTFIMEYVDELLVKNELPYFSEVKNKSNINILVNEDSASAAEIIAVLLRINLGAKIYGTPTTGVISSVESVKYKNIEIEYPLCDIIYDGKVQDNIIPDSTKIPAELLPHKYIEK